MHAPAHVAAAVFQAGIVVAGVVAVRRADISSAINAVFALAVTLVPAALSAFAPAAVGDAVSSSSGLLLWLAVAGFVHVVGMLGWYDTVWWWDHLTHTVSATLLGALVYSGLTVAAESPAGPALTSHEVAGVTVGLVLAVGVAWELVELLARDLSNVLGIDPVLVHYGRRDTAFDLVFDAVGALIVVVADLQLFRAVAAASPGATCTALVWTWWAVASGSAVLAVAVLLARYTSESR
jgi:hypothetical protein